MTASADSVHVPLQVVGIDQRGAGGEKVNTGFRWVDGIGTVTEIRQDSPTVAPGGKKSAAGPGKLPATAHTVHQHKHDRKNTTHRTTAQSMHQYC